MPSSKDDTTAGGPAKALHSPELASKLSPGAKQRLMAPEPAGAEARALLKISAALGDDDRRALEGAGVTVRTVAGDVVSAVVPMDRIDAVLELPFLRYLDLARPMHMESSEGSEEPEEAPEPSPEESGDPGGPAEDC